MKSVGPSNLYRKLLLYMRWSHRARPIMANQAIKCFPCTKLCKNPPTVSCSLKSSECITHDNLDVYFLKLGLEKLSTITFISSSAISFYDKLYISFWCSLAGHPCSFFFFLFLLYCILTWPLIIDTFDEFRFTGSAWASFLQGWGNLACMYWYVFHSYDRPDLPYEFFDCNSNKNV